ncbi:MAG: hypothetical protein IH840_17790, partial [Candidatus Heimdallarchaeota archaeon]|nr:hypothetical protein [Candidatus Heimdallarchaeota archaeon]
MKLRSYDQIRHIEVDDTYKLIEEQNDPNLDTERFETYIGFNKNASAPGRYADKSRKNKQGYKGVALLGETPIKDITRDNIDNLINELGSTKEEYLKSQKPTHSL